VASNLVEMGAFSKSNDGYRYLLTVIDTFSKYAWGEAWREYLNRVMEHQKKMQADNGPEFFNSKFKVL